MDAIVVALAIIIGVMLGSFSNVVIYRVPRGESVVSPPSACPSCGTRIKARHNVPVLSWLWLRRRCAACRAPISARYPLVESSMGASFGAIVAVKGLTWESALLLVLAAFTIVLSAIDIDVRRLPDPLVAAMAVVVAGVIVVAAIVQGDWTSAARAAVGAAAVGLLYGLAFVIYPAGLGFGDVKLAPVLGAIMGYFGWGVLVVGTFSAFLWGAIAGVVAMVAARRARKVAIPFGPWMFAGTWTGLFFGEHVWSWYLHDVSGLGT